MPLLPRYFPFRRARFRVGRALSTAKRRDLHSQRKYRPDRAMARSAGPVLDLPSRAIRNDKKRDLRAFPLRLAWLLSAGAAVGRRRPGVGQTASPPQRPFGQLDRRSGRASSTASPPAPSRPTCCRSRSTPCASRWPTCARRPRPPPPLARSDLADTRKLLAPLEAKPGGDAVPETDAVKADRERLTELATVSESRVKQCEVMIARADQLIERLTKLRGEVMLRTPCCTATPRRCRATSGASSGRSSATALQTLSTATGGVGPRRPERLSSGTAISPPWAVWAILTVAAVGGRAASCAAASAAARRPSPASATAPSPPPSTASAWCWCRSSPSG